jgi:SAM-dependent methyltransferase
MSTAAAGLKQWTGDTAGAKGTERVATTTTRPSSKVVGAAGQPVWDLALDLLSAERGGDLLETAAGGGFLATQLQDRGFRVTGSDLVDQWQFPDIPFVQADLDEPLPLPDTSFDAALCIEGIGFVESPMHLMREFHRILRPGGAAVITLPNILSLQSRMRFFLNGTYRWFPHPPFQGESKEELFDIHRDPIRATTLAFYAMRAGFTVERIGFGGKKTGGILTPLGLPLQGMSALHNSFRKGKGKQTPAVVNSWPALTHANMGILARKPRV